MLSYLRYNRISNGDYCKCMCLYSIYIVHPLFPASVEVQLVAKNGRYQ